MLRIKFLVLIGLVLLQSVQAQSFITEEQSDPCFPVVAEKAATIFVDSKEDILLHKMAKLLQKDIEMVTGKSPDIIQSVTAPVTNLIVIGTIDKSTVINEMVSANKMNVAALKSKWEAFQLQTVADPVKGVSNALVITGSDRRGAAFGVAELSFQMGVSPWYWWADVPVKNKANVFLKNGIYPYPSPSVKYRGIFINDEAPAFSGWTKEKFGGFNHKMYEHLFELLIRLKANYLWPAMWGNAFNDDDTLNPVKANEWGIVMGTSHHEPMMRAQAEWARYGTGEWNYEANESGLKQFWENGIKNMRNHESIVTIGMRGDGDEPMTEGTAIGLLEKIVGDQREILTEVTGKPANEIPQLWAIYKEVQEYYDQGMRVPDDVTLLLCDDNWGNIRRLPRPDEKPRKGGYGIYYHFDYVGGPRNYRWINTNNIARVWEQMHLAYEHHVRDIWIVNVGDLKPMELPTTFFLDFAWNVNSWNADNLSDYYRMWAATQFGETHVDEIAEMLSTYAQYASRRKPELLDANTFSIVNYNEAERVTEDWNILLHKAELLYTKIPQNQRAAFFQLVLHPVKAYATLQNMYTAVAWNHFFAKQRNPLANKYAKDAKLFYEKDSLIAVEYHQINNGKWNHMMSQKHIGYTSWQEPRVQKMPEVKYVEVSAVVQPERKDGKTLKAKVPKNTGGNVFYEQDGCVAILTTNFTRKIDKELLKWKTVPNIAREGDGVTLFPVTSVEELLLKDAPQLHYDFYTYSSGDFKLKLYASPTLNYLDTDKGLQYAVSVNDGAPVIVSVNKFKVDGREWSETVSKNINVSISKHKIAKKGKNTVKIWAINPGVVFQKIVIDFGGAKPSYLGPPETKVSQ